MHKGKIYGIDERSAKLFEKAKEKLARANEIVTTEITNEAYQAMVESAQSALLYVGKHPGNAEAMANDLVKHFSNIIEQKHVDNLKEAYAMVERIKREPKVFDSEEGGLSFGSSSKSIFDARRIDPRRYNGNPFQQAGRDWSRRMGKSQAEVI